MRAGEGRRGRDCWKWMLCKRETASGRWAVIPAPLAGRLLSWGRGRKWGVGGSVQGWGGAHRALF